MPDIDSLSGRALDAAVAERVMGWQTRLHKYSNHEVEWFDTSVSEYDGSYRCSGRHLPAFSSDWSAAALVVERMREMGWDFRAHGPMSDKWQAFFTLADESDDAHMEGDTFPTSVCRAALMAMEAKRV